MRSMITRLIMAQLIPVGIKLAKKFFSKKKKAAAQPDPHLDNVNDVRGLDGSHPE